MKVARTEHSMSLVYGLPTIIGGVNGDQFISSIEQFDKSGNRWAGTGQLSAGHNTHL